MHFILKNYKKDKSFKVTKHNNIYVLDAEINNIKYHGKEVYTPLQFYVCDVKDNKITVNDFKEAKLINVEVFTDNKELQNTQDIEYEQLITEFGDKRAKTALKKRSADKAPPAQKVKYNVENTLLPEITEETTLSDLFSKNVVDKSKEIVNASTSDNMFVQICDILELDQVEIVAKNEPRVYFEKKCLLIFIDYLYKLFECKIITKHNLPDKYQGLFEIVAADLMNKRMPRILKDKLVSKFYLLVLMYNNNNANISKLPLFNYSKTKQINLLKAFGCTISKSGDITIKY